MLGCRCDGSPENSRLGAALLALILAGSVACTVSDDQADGDRGDDPMDDPVEPGVDLSAAEFLSPVQHLIRVSVALRGVRPDPSDIDAVLESPDRLPELVDDYLEDARFGDTVRDLHNESLLMRVERLRLPSSGSMSDIPMERINRSIMEAPLRLVEHVVASDRPYTEIVTADYFLADDIVARVWAGVDGFQPDGDDWQVVGWSDGRPTAGILSSSAFYFRHGSNGANFHRARANTVASSLLCYDFLSTDILLEGDVDLSDPEAVANAVVENPACASCHQTLDPLASLFFGMEKAIPTQQVTYPISMWNQDKASSWQFITGREPGYFGLPASDLQELGAQIAEDPRFSLCAARRFYAFLTHTPLERVAHATAADLQTHFVESNFDVKALVKRIVLSDDFRVSHSSGEASDEILGYKKLRPEQIARAVEDLTGFYWETEVAALEAGRVDLMRTDIAGYRVLFGGIDSLSVTLPSLTYNPTAVLVLENYALQAAAHVVAADFAESDASKRRLLGAIPDTGSDPDQVRAHLEWLQLRIFGDTAEESVEAVDHLAELYQEAFALSGDNQRAWTITLASILSSPRMAFY